MTNDLGNTRYPGMGPGTLSPYEQYSVNKPTSPTPRLHSLRAWWRNSTPASWWRRFQELIRPSKRYLIDIPGTTRRERREEVKQVRAQVKAARERALVVAEFSKEDTHEARDRKGIEWEWAHGFHPGMTFEERDEEWRHRLVGKQLVTFGQAAPQTMDLSDCCHEKDLPPWREVIPAGHGVLGDFEPARLRIYLDGDHKITFVQLG